MERASRYDERGFGIGHDHRSVSSVAASAVYAGPQKYMLGGSMLRSQFAPLEIYETEYQALASLGAEVRVGRSGSEPKYASELPLLEVREIDEVVCVGFRSENPGCD